MSELIEFLVEQWEWVVGSGIFATLIGFALEKFFNKNEETKGYHIGNVNAKTINIYNTEKIKHLNNSKSNKDSKLELVDVVLGDDEYYFCTIDIKIRNIGERVAFLKQAVININQKDVLEDPSEPKYAVIPITCNYDFLLSLDKDQKKLEKKISHKIKPNDVERISFTIISKELGPEKSGLFQLSLDLLYDGDNKFINIPSLLIGLSDSKQWEENSEYNKNPKIVAKNQKILEKYNKLNGLKNSQFISILSNQVKQND